MGQKLRTTWPRVMQMNLMLWPWVQFTNFKFVPLQHRVLVVNVVSLGELRDASYYIVMVKGCFLS